MLATVSLNDPVVGHCLAAAIPVVLVNRSDAGRRLPAVVTDDEAGMRLAVDHLVALGPSPHRPYRGSAGRLDRRAAPRRLQGRRCARGLAGAKHRDRDRAAPIRARQARLAALRLLDRKPAPTAIVAANDLLALGIYDALGERGLSCPTDVSVVGHNDMPYVDMLSPPLTTVRIAQREMGNQAARLLLDAIAGPAARRERVVLAPTLIVRGSTARPE